MAGSILGTGLSGLRAAQTGLSTAGHNIANVNTEGYSRQRVDTATLLPQRVATGFIGKGVNVTAITRIFDSFVTTQMRTAQSSASRAEVFRELSDGLDRLLGGGTGSIGPALQSFFDTLQDAASDPGSLAVRQAVLNQAGGLLERFRALDQQLAELASGLNQRLVGTVGEINTIAQGIADLNQRILLAEGSVARPGAANDLRDQREELVRRLAERVDVIAIEQDGGLLVVGITNGNALVAGTQTIPVSLVAGAFDPQRLEVAIGAGGAAASLGNPISGGSLGGLLAYRQDVLEPARSALGRIAAGLAQELNAQHRLGQDLQGNAGGNLLRPLADTAAGVFGHAGNAGTPPAELAVTLLDAGQLGSGDYLLSRSGATFSLQRLPDGQSTVLTGFPASPALVDGMRISLDAGAIDDGDRLLIQPVQAASRELYMAFSDPRALALAAPVRSSASLLNIGTASVGPVTVNSPRSELVLTFNSPPTSFDVVAAGTGAILASDVPYVPGAPLSFNGLGFDIGGAPAAGDRFSITGTVSAAGADNTGSGTISEVTAVARDPALTDPVTITFDDPPGTFTVTGATTGLPVAAVPYVSGQPISFNGWTVAISGTLGAGDSFTISANTAGVGDNRNALAIGALQTRRVLDGGLASFQEAFGGVLTRVGSQTREAQSEHGTQQLVLAQVHENRASVSGVNLDEEAADLLRFQQSYQASAQLIRVADELFQTLLGAVRR